jgi:hypothetical protein
VPAGVPAEPVPGASVVPDGVVVVPVVVDTELGNTVVSEPAALPRVYAPNPMPAPSVTPTAIRTTRREAGERNMGKVLSGEAARVRDDPASALPETLGVRRTAQ